MNSFRPKNIIILIAAALSVSICQACAASRSVPCPGSCFRQYQCLLQDCNDTFNNDDPNNVDYQNEQAWNTCQDAASAYREACEDNIQDNLLDAFWDELIDNLQSCIDLFGEGSDDPAANPDNLNECIEEALQVLQDRIDDATDDQNACSGHLVPQRALGGFFVGQMDALRLAAIDAGNPDGKYPTKVNKTVTITAGIGVQQGNQYDASQIPCVKTAIAYQIYQTKTGTAILPIDADIDAADGVNFDIMFFGNKLIDATDVSVLAVYFDENDRPVFAEIGEFSIIDSPITGDWNRDEVLNSQDITDFLESFNAQTNRADLNEDQQVNQEDAAEFLNDNPE